ncbi:hypothetical protein NW813_05130 [Synechococcus sp. R55.6]
MGRSPAWPVWYERLSINWGSLVLPRKLMVAQADLNFGRSEQGF